MLEAVLTTLDLDFLVHGDDPEGSLAPVTNSFFGLPTFLLLAGEEVATNSTSSATSAAYLPVLMKVVVVDQSYHCGLHRGGLHHLELDHLSLSSF